MAKKTKKHDRQKATDPIYTHLQLSLARQHTIALGVVVVLSLAYDGWRVVSALREHTHVFLPFVLFAIPLAAFALFLVSLWSWLNVRLV